VPANNVRQRDMEEEHASGIAPLTEDGSRLSLSVIVSVTGGSNGGASGLCCMKPQSADGSPHLPVEL